MKLFCSVEECYYNEEDTCMLEDGPHIVLRMLHDLLAHEVTSFGACSDYKFTVGEKHGTTGNNTTGA